ncbi:hypothetical protein BUALT_Bualt01G0176100 [Buddleja alternifolia]|uniref:DC1 domain-containing protein n=1 Tax=Buddleja alternifolia TaxID=168488 RepID=A0AAV6YC56_9LAMI|nr:hypothetical protein BUALT_Bualt01G0176100 [Buddleja alternifolia]
MEFKHFSHKHDLISHQMSQSSKIHCSGCKSPGLENAYVCWKCNDFLHEQCFHAARSLKHPSHPLHPLTLAPFPTYFPGSFFYKYCNSDGNGFSYSCSECEFDIHVHCAHISNAHNPRPQNPIYPSHIQNNAFSRYLPLDPTIPNDVQSYPPPQPQVTNFPPNPNNHFSNVFPPNTTIPNQTRNYASPQTYPSNHNNPIPGFSQPNPNFGNVHYPNPNLSLPKKTIPNQTQNYAIPRTNTYPSNQNNHIHVPPNLSPPNTTIPNQTQNYTIPHTNTYPPNQNNPIPAFPQSNPNFVNTPNPNPPRPPQPNATMPTYSTTANATTTNPPPTPPPISQPAPFQFPQTNNPESKPPTMIKHLSHPHDMKPMEIEQKYEKVCSACECELFGSAYNCTEPHCNFNLHKTCFETPMEIWHNSQLQQPLTLQVVPPYNDGFTCDACAKHGTTFANNCATCSYDLHINRVNWPETVSRPDHKHNLTLYYSSPLGEANQDVTFTCDVCHNQVQNMAWAYHCRECDFAMHLECVAFEVKQVSAKTEEELVRELNEVRLLALEMKIRVESRKVMLDII